ncbi:MAG: hypothetical protein H6930_09510 [Rhodoferax sp.]|nr:hypothetical protein [Rhodoferax sp.]
MPLREFAQANQHDPKARSSASPRDLSPLLEQTKHGLMFRDEPTETIQRSYAGDAAPLRELATNLVAMQVESVYAATTLTCCCSWRTARSFSSWPSMSAACEHHRHRGPADYRHAQFAPPWRTPIGQRPRTSYRCWSDCRSSPRWTSGNDVSAGLPDLVVASADPDSLRRIFEHAVAGSATPAWRLRMG